MIKIKLFFIFVVAFLISTISATSQSLTGRWEGYFTVYDYTMSRVDTFPFSLHIEQSGDSLIAKTYTKIPGFYAEAKAEITFDVKRKKLLIKENEVVRMKSDGMGYGACLMHFDLQYKKLKYIEELLGTFISFSSNNSDCGKGKVYLSRSKPEIE